MLEDEEIMRNGEEPVPAQEPSEAAAADVPAPQEALPGESGTPAPDNAGFQRHIEEQLREIRQYDPSIRTVQDLTRLDRSDRLFDEVQNHAHTFAEAYRFVYADRIAEARLRRSLQRAAQRARSADQGKAHMRATGAVGTGEAAVPAQVEKNIRAIMPKATAKEIRDFYRKYARETG